EGAKLAGREAGNPRRETARPTAERLREAFEGLPLTVVVTGCQQTDRHLTTLSPLQQRLLEILGCSLALYTRLCTVSSEPPEKWANRKYSGSLIYPRVFSPQRDQMLHRAMLWYGYSDCPSRGEFSPHGDNVDQQVLG